MTIATFILLSLSCGRLRPEIWTVSISKDISLRSVHLRCCGKKSVFVCKRNSNEKSNIQAMVYRERIPNSRSNFHQIFRFHQFKTAEVCCWWPFVPPIHATPIQPLDLHSTDTQFMCSVLRSIMSCLLRTCGPNVNRNVFLFPSNPLQSNWPSFRIPVATQVSLGRKISIVSEFKWQLQTEGLPNGAWQTLWPLVGFRKHQFYGMTTAHQRNKKQFDICI